MASVARCWVDLSRWGAGCSSRGFAWRRAAPADPRTVRRSGHDRNDDVGGLGCPCLGDRFKTNGRDAELLAHSLLAGSLKQVIVPAPEVEAARELTRAHDACRRDLMTTRRRVSKVCHVMESSISRTARGAQDSTQARRDACRRTGAGARRGLIWPEAAARARRCWCAAEALRQARLECWRCDRACLAPLSRRDRSLVQTVTCGPRRGPTHQPQRRAALRRLKHIQVHEAEPFIQCRAALAAGLDIRRHPG
jgi:hypothetical protein